MRKINQKLLLILFIFFGVYYASMVKADEPFTLLTPSNGEVVYADSDINISWNTTISREDIIMQKISYTDSYGQALTNALPENSYSNSVPAGTNSYSWKVPSNADSLVGIELYVSYYDSSHKVEIFSKKINIDVKQQAEIDVLEPKTGSIFNLGDSISVKYVYHGSGNPDYLSSKFSLYRGDKLLKDDIYISGSEQFWLDDPSLLAGDDYKIKFKIGSVESFSPNFTVKVPPLAKVTVDSPKKGDTLKIGNVYNIVWSTGKESTYKYVDVFLDFGTITNGDYKGQELVYPLRPFGEFQVSTPFFPNVGRYTWLVPEEFSPSYYKFLNPVTGVLSDSAYEAKYEQGNMIFDAPTKIIPGDYRLYVKLSGGSIFSTSDFSDYFVISKTDSVITPSSPAPTIPTATTTVPTNKKIDVNLTNRLKGQIVLQVESKGEAYYINPKDGKGYYMADGSAAYDIMRNLGIGITNKDLDKIKTDAYFRKKYIGKIFLQVEAHGEAYYISANGRYNYLKDGAAAYEIMSSLGLGISTSNLEKIATGSK